MRDEIIPSTTWTFDENVASVFPDMLKRSIPDLDGMRELVHHMVSEYFVDDEIIITDIGCSDGQQIELMLSKTDKWRFAGVDVSSPMVDIAKAKFGDNSRVEILEGDIRNVADILPHSDVFLVILTMQFIPVEHRQILMKKIYNHLANSGILIFVEKTLGGSPIITEWFINAYHSWKMSNGYSQEQVEAKRKSLEHALVPYSVKQNEALLESCGFKDYEMFWKYMNFCGWVAVK